MATLGQSRKISVVVMSAHSLNGPIGPAVSGVRVALAWSDTGSLFRHARHSCGRQSTLSHETMGMDMPFVETWGSSPASPCLPPFSRGLGLILIRRAFRS